VVAGGADVRMRVAPIGEARTACDRRETLSGAAWPVSGLGFEERQIMDEEVQLQIVRDIGPQPLGVEH
jgi:hypothetical protein